MPERRLTRSVQMMDYVQQGRAEAKLCKIAVDLAFPGKIEPGP
jgi:hypothetical protein